MKVKTKEDIAIINSRTAIPIEKIKSIHLDKSKRYNIHVPVDNPFVKNPIIKKVKAILILETDWFFSFRIKTKAGEYRIETISKFDYLKMPSLIEVIG